MNENRAATPRLPMTPATWVTVGRMVLVPVFLVVLLSPWPDWIQAPKLVTVLQPLIAALVFIALAATDGVDGYLARSRGEVTTLGKFLDPLADKILIAAALIALVELRTLPSWVVVVILSREFIVSGLRMVASVEGVVIAASWIGKAKTFVTIVAVVIFLIKDMAILPQIIGSGLTSAFHWLSWGVMGAAVALTLWSAVDYFRGAAEVLMDAARDSHHH